MRDLRRAPRVAVNNMLVHLPQGARLVRGDVSLFGVGFEIYGACHLKVGDPIEIRLFLTDQTLTLRAAVTRVHRFEPLAVGRIHVGAKLKNVDELVLNPLYRFVEETLLLSRPLSDVDLLTAQI